jgi:peroxiredoxin
MAVLQTPKMERGQNAHDFKLLGTDGRYHALHDCAKKHGIVVMFISNHCPYVKAILPRLMEDAKALLAADIGCVAICSNDTKGFPEDSYQNMQKIAKEMQFPFPYLVDESQDVARAYGAVCTPDFFGYNSNFALQYRGRLDASGINPAPEGSTRELVEAMKTIAATGKGPQDQKFSQGCSIKWRRN